MVNDVIEPVADLMQAQSDAVSANLGNIIGDYAKLRKENSERSLDLHHAVIKSGSQLMTEHDEKCVSTLGEMANQWSCKYSERTISRNDTFRTLTADFAEFHKWILEDKEQHTVDGHLFNVFHLFGRHWGIDEPKHSKLLHFLLSDDELHGQRNKFMLEFLNLAGIDNPEVGKWEVTAETGGRVDVMLKRSHPHSVVIVENKSNWAGDQANQLYRYWYQNIHRYSEDLDEKYYERNNRYRIIYLAPNEDKNYSEQTCCKPSKKWFSKHGKRCDYDKLPDKLPLKPVAWTFNGRLQEWLERCMEILDVSNHPVREYIRQYKEYCKTL